MKNKLKILAPFLLIALAVVLLAGGTVGNVRAALTYYSDNYDLDIEVPSIGVTLTENGRNAAWRNYLPDNRTDSGSSGLLSWAAGTDFRPGQYYDEKLAVTNTGNIDEYVKVEIYKYWTDAEGNKITELEPDQIEFQLGTGTGWYVDEAASTAERTVLYYTLPLAPDERTTDLSEEILMAADVLEKISETDVKNDANGRTFTVTYAYDGVRMCLDADVYAVQTHNAAQAIRSAWGKQVTVGGSGELTFAN